MSTTQVSDAMRVTTALDATKLTGNLPAISGANLTNLGGLLEYSRGAKNGAVTISSTTAIDVGIRANLNPTSTSDIIRINHFWSSSDSTSGSAQDHQLWKSLDGGAFTQHIQWADYMNHWSDIVDAVRTTSSLWWIGTAGDLGWSTGVLSIGVKIALQSTGTWIYNEGFNGAANGAAKQMSFIEAFRYSASTYTAGTDS